MGIYVRRATLLDRILGILMLPFAFMMLAIWVKRRVAVVVVFAVALVWWCTYDPKSPWIDAKTLESWKETAFDLAMVILFLMAVAVLGTIWDQIRFRGWIDDGEPKISAESVDAVLSALVAGDSDRMRNCFSDHHKPHQSEFESQFGKWRTALGEHTNAVTSKQLCTVDHEIFRHSLPGIFQMGIGYDKAILLIPMIKSLQHVVGKPMKVALIVLSLDTLESQIAGFNILTIPRPEILS